jgi:glycosyltransferase involved in cell wall biosynthesis
MKLSSIIIAKDEEKNIGRCIQSQLDCIDEIIILVDKYSKDSTLNIVKSFLPRLGEAGTGPSVKYEVVEWLGYSETKKYGISKTSNNWILWIDADEVLTKGLVKELKDFKQTTPEFVAYSFPRKANFLGRWILHSGWYPASVTRLFNKDNVTFSNSKVHEQLIIKGKTGNFKNDIEHYTDPDIKHYFEKFNKYTTLAAEELDGRGKAFKILDILIRPVVIFIKMFILKRGFLDGFQGFILAMFSSAYVFTKYCKLWEQKIIKGGKYGTKHN